MKFSEPKYYIFLIILFSFAENCKSSEPIPSPPVKKERKPLSVQRLTSLFWGQGDFNYGWGLTFHPKGRFEEEFSGEGCGGYSGAYRLQGEQLILSADPEPYCKPENFALKRTCTLQPEIQDQFYEENLSCSNNAKYYGDGRTEPGSRKQIHGIEIVILKMEAKKAMANIRFRDKPSLQSNIYSCSLLEGDGLRKEVPYLPKGTEFRLMARTLEKETINGKEEYWYYAKAMIDWYSSCSIGENSADTAWIFGGYLK